MSRTTTTNHEINMPTPSESVSPQAAAGAVSAPAVCSPICRCLNCMVREAAGLKVCHKRAMARCAQQAGAWLARRRQMAGISMSDAARRAGVSKMFFSHVERGLRMPNAEMAKKLMEATQANAEAQPRG